MYKAGAGGSGCFVLGPLLPVKGKDTIIMRVSITDGDKNVALILSADEAFEMGLRLIQRARNHSRRNEGRSVYSCTDGKKFHVLFNQNDGCPWKHCPDPRTTEDDGCHPGCWHNSGLDEIRRRPINEV